MEKDIKELPDHHTYDWIWFYPDTFDFFIKSLEFYASLIESDLKAIREDPDLKVLVDDERINSLDISNELDRVNRILKWLNEMKEKDGENTFEYDLHNISHGFIRYLKSISTLYLNHLKIKRNRLSEKSNISRYAIKTVDQRVSQLEEKLNMGVFENATLVPLLLDEVSVLPDNSEHFSSDIRISEGSRPRPVILDSIQIFDKELKERCLDLYQQFSEDGKHERLDTVVTESTRILENRIRRLTNAPNDCTGVDLAKYAFGKENPKLMLSNISAEQESSHLLFRGVFGFIRNPIHHKLVESLNPERVLQLLGLIDYLLHLVESTKRRCQSTKRGQVK